MAAVTATLTADVNGYIAAMNRAAAATQSFAGKATQAGQRAAASTKSFADSASTYVTKNKDHINTLSNGLGLFGAAVGAGVAIAAKKFADFDQAMSNVAATGADAKQNLSALKDAAIDAGASTQFSATQAAEGIENLAKAGVSAKDTLGGGLKGALDLAAAGQISVADAAETAATAMTQFNLTGKDVPHIADLLAAGAGKAQGEVSDMAMALKQSGLVAAQFGLSLEETTGTLAAFASAGLLGSDAGTSFKTMLLRLANPSAEAAATMKQLGIAAYDAQGNFVGIAPLAEQLKKSMSGLSQAQRDAALSTIFGSDAIRAANVLYKDGGSGIQTWINNVNDSGYAAEVAKTKMDNLKGDLENLSGAFETALIGLGEGANGPLRSLVQGATDAVNAFNDLGSGTKGAVLAVAGGLSAIALSAAGIGKIAIFASEAKGALAGLGISARVAGIAVGGITAGVAIAATAFGILASKQAESKARIEDFTSALRDNSSAIQANVTAVAAKQLQDAGALSAARDLGLSLDTVTQAALGNAQALQLVTAATDAAAQAGLNSNDVDVLQRVDSANLLADAVGRTGSEYNKAVQDARDFQSATGDTAAATDQAAAGATQAGSALSGMGADAASAEQSLNDLVNSLFAVGSAALSASNSQIGFKQAVKDAADAADKNGKTLNKHKTALTANTEAGRANKTALNNLASSGQRYVESLVEQGKSSKKVAAATQQVRGEFVSAARQMGLSKAQANKLADSYGLIPKNVKTKVDAPGAKGAKTDADKFLASLKRLPPKQQAKILSIFNRQGIDAAKSALHAIDGTTAHTYVKTIYQKGQPPKGKLVPQIATGGYITGPGTATSDSIPANLSNGEYVIRAAAVRAYGVDNLHAINAMGYKDGGLVGFAAGGSVDVARIMRMIAQFVTPLTEVRAADLALKRAQIAKAKEDRDVAAARKQQKRARTKKQKSAAKSNLTKQLEEQKTAQEKLTESTKALADAQNTAADTARQVSDQFSNAFRSASTDARDWLDTMGQGAKDLTGFTAQIKELRKRGLSETLIQQLIGQGAADGGEAAASILAGGKGLVDQLNKSNAALQKAADALGYISALQPQRKVLGGPVVGPGSGTSDSVLVAASNGEYVVNAAASAANRPLLDRINYGRSVVSNNYARPGHYRYGGSISTGLTAQAMAGAFAGMRIVGELEMVGSRALIRGIAVETYADQTRRAEVAKN